MKVGPEYWDSAEQQKFDARAGRILLLARVCARQIARATFGYETYTDIRVGRNSELVEIPKIKTLDENGNPLSMVATFFREKGLDELEQLSLITDGTMSLIGSRHLLESDVDTIHIVAQRTNRGRSLLAEYNEIVTPNKRGLLSSFAFHAHMLGDDSVEARLALDIHDYQNMSTRYNLKLLRKGSRALALNELQYGSHPVTDNNERI